MNYNYIRNWSVKWITSTPPLVYISEKGWIKNPSGIIFTRSNERKMIFFHSALVSTAGSGTLCITDSTIKVLIIHAACKKTTTTTKWVVEHVKKHSFFYFQVAAPEWFSNLGLFLSENCLKTKWKQMCDCQ